MNAFDKIRHNRTSSFEYFLTDFQAIYSSRKATTNILYDVILLYQEVVINRIGFRFFTNQKLYSKRRSDV